MADGYAARVLADSISPDGVRLTTLEVTFPRFILAEVNTHRMLSRNSASSRAIPTEKQIERVIRHPFIPETFNKRVKGMGVGAAFDPTETEQARIHWLAARDEAVRYADRLNRLDVDKSRVNRILEPFLWHTAIISATEWDNFFALRDHEAAQPEFRITAQLMRKVMEESEPLHIRYGEWHLPLVDDGFPYDSEDPIDWEFWAKVSAGRCARVSFDTQDNYEEPGKSVERAERLMKSGHLSPFEHCARPSENDVYGERPWHFFGNLRGWVQYRKQIPNESNFGLIESAE